MKIFISYRRDDSRGVVDLITERLKRVVGTDNVFRDIDMTPGAHFLKKIRAALTEADIMLVVIGRGWLGDTPEGERRIDDPNDWVRIEIREALKQKDVRLVPLLVDGASMPGEDDLPPGLKDLPYYQYVELDQSRGKLHCCDLDELPARLGLVGIESPHPQVTDPPPPAVVLPPAGRVEAQPVPEDLIIPKVDQAAGTAVDAPPVEPLGDAKKDPPRPALRLRRPLAAAAVILLLAASAPMIPHLLDYFTARPVEPPRPEDPLQEGLIALASGRAKAAIDLFTRAIEKSPNSADAYCGRGRANLALSQPDQAISDFDHALKINPQAVEALTGRGRALESKGAHLDAIRDLKKAIALGAKEASAYLDLARAFDATGQKTEARVQFDKAIELDDRSAAAFAARGEFHLFQSPANYEAAYRDFGRAIELDRSNAWYHYRRGYALTEMAARYNDKDSKLAFRSAIKDLDEAITLQPDLVPAYGSRAYSHSKLEDLEKAEADYNRGIELVEKMASAGGKLDEEVGWFYDRRGMLRENRGQLAEAEADYTKAITLGHDLKYSHINRGRVRLRLGRERDGYEDLDKVPLHVNDAAEPYVLRGEIYVEIRDFTKAIECYDKAIKLRRPPDPDLFDRRGSSYQALGNEELAKADADTARKLRSGPD